MSRIVVRLPGTRGPKPLTHCRRGLHELTEDNLDLHKGARRCKQCRRARQARQMAARRARHRALHPPAPPKTHCVHGHERTPENLTTRGACRECNRAASRRRYREQKVEHPRLIPNEQLREAVLAQEKSTYIIARDCGWTRRHQGKVIPDSTKVARALGLSHTRTRGARVVQSRIDYDVAVAISRCIGADPFEVGL